jgi:hypothetical protein
MNGTQRESQPSIEHHSLSRNTSNGEREREREDVRGEERERKNVGRRDLAVNSPHFGIIVAVGEMW